MSTTPTAGTPASASLSQTAASHGFDPLDTFARRHLGPDAAETAAMLEALGVASIDALMAEAIPASIRMHGGLELEKAPGDSGTERGEHEMLSALRSLAAKNEVFRSFIGLGYHGTITPPVVLRNVLENPGWYTQYTPYQAEIGVLRRGGLPSADDRGRRDPRVGARHRGSDRTRLGPRLARRSR
jgi:glycine dehydrogenase